VANQQALQLARLLVVEASDLAFDFFPLRLRVQQQAMIAVDGQYHLSAADARQLFAIARRDRHATLAVQRYRVDTTKHFSPLFPALFHKKPQFTT
jgi:hypothetical protein